MMPAWLRFPPPWVFIALTTLGLVVVAVIMNRCDWTRPMPTGSARASAASLDHARSSAPIFYYCRRPGRRAVKEVEAAQ
jgi:hypothetical protein